MRIEAQHYVTFRTLYPQNPIPHTNDKSPEKIVIGNQKTHRSNGLAAVSHSKHLYDEG